MPDDHIPPPSPPVPPETKPDAAHGTPGFNGIVGNGAVEPRTAPAPAATAAPPAPAARRGFWRALWGTGPAASGGAPGQTDSVREVVETIVFVVVLVLMLKSFAAEAFVIPTGSMAQTLWGYQKVVECPDCHTEFPVNCSSEVDPSDGRLEPIYACICPNCRQHIHFYRPDDRHQTWAGDSVEVRDPGWNSGDRVLVAKFVYDLLRRDPERLDVVVFKYPGDDKFPLKGPYLNNVPMNYIKRLIGLPGETIAIHGGNIYSLSPDKSPPWDDFKLAKNDPEKFATLWQKKHMHVNSTEARRLWDAGQFQIIRKDAETLLAMMRPVYDNDHPGKGLPERWGGAEGWQAEGRGFRIDGKADKGAWLRYSHTPNRDLPHQRELITDFMGYNTFANSNHPHPPGENWVNDLILECEVTLPDQPAGELTLELSRGIDRFRARWDLGAADGQCTLYRVGANGEQRLDGKPTALKGKGTYRLRFADCDERLTVWVDGRLPFDQGVPFRPPAEEGPRAENDLEPASVGVKGAAVQVRKLKVFRDTYYTANDNPPSAPDVGGVNFGNPGTWGDLGRLPVLTLYVQPEHYLCLGDNSPESSDGRSWGTVPKRLLLGRAVMVYYPFSRAGRIR
jgi:signal peptidase I